MSRDNLWKERAVLNSRAEQLRAEAMEFLHGKGEDYTMALDAIISDIQKEESEHKRILGVLAEIGFIAVFSWAAEAMNDGSNN